MANSANGQAPDSNAAAASPTPTWHIETVMRLGDDALVLAQRVSEWTGHGPVLEEDLAMANIGLDLLGQARMLLSHAGHLEAAGRDEDALAYFRDSHQFRNHSLTELPNGNSPHDDYALTIARNYLHSERMVLTWQALSGSSDEQIAAIASKAIKEARGHLRHSHAWLVRFGDGTEDSHQRAQAAIDRLWPYTHEYFADDDTDKAAAQAGIAPLPSSLREKWLHQVKQTLAQATLNLPTDTSFVSTGKRGIHTEFLDYLLAEMQSVARAHPGAKW